MWLLAATFLRAVKEGNEEKVALLLRERSSGKISFPLNFTDNQGKSAFSLALISKHNAIIKMIAMTEGVMAMPTILDYLIKFSNVSFVEKFLFKRGGEFSRIQLKNCRRAVEAAGNEAVVSLLDFYLQKMPLE